MDRARQKIDDILRLGRRWKLLTTRKFLYLPHILSRQEKRLIVLLIIVAILTGGGLATRGYLHFTHPVPGVGGSYTEGVIAAPRAINPLYLSRDTDRDIARLVFSGLLTYDGSGNITPDLAERYDISSDGKTYTAYLRKNALWHDGKSLTADDVVFTIARIQNPQYKSPVRANWQGVEAVKVDASTIRFTLRTPYAPFIENLTQGIIPKHLWEHVEPAQALLHELNMSPIGSGPYQFNRFKSKSDGSLVWFALTRNPHYYREGPYLKDITLVFFNSEDEMIASLHRGEIEGFGPIASAHAEEVNRDRNTVLALATPRIFSVFFNAHQSPALTEVSVREAIARALDRGKITEEGSAGGAIGIDTLLPPFAQAVNQSISFPAYDPDRSRSLLDAAGWKDANGDGIRDKKIRDKKKTKVVPLRFTLATGDAPELKRAAELIKQMLADVGIGVDIQEKSFTDLESSVIRPRAFDMLLFGQVYGYEPDPFAFWHSSQIKDPGLNVTLFADKKADKALEDARRATDRAIRDKKYQEFAAIAAQDMPAIPLYTQLYLYLLPRDIQGASFSRITLPADRFNEINRWYRTTRRVF